MTREQKCYARKYLTQKKINNGRIEVKTDIRVLEKNGKMAGLNDSLLVTILNIKELNCPLKGRSDQHGV